MYKVSDTKRVQQSGPFSNDDGGQKTKRLDYNASAVATNVAVIICYDDCYS